MQFSTLYNNVAHRAFDTSTSGITRAKEAVNDAYQYILTRKHKWSWATDRVTPEEITLVSGDRDYAFTDVGRILRVWVEDNGREYNIKIYDNVKDFNRISINDTTYATYLSACYIDYFNSQIIFDVFPSSSFISTYTTVYYIGKDNVTELSNDTDVPILPDYLHRQLQDLATEYRKYDKGTLDFATFEAIRKNIITSMIEEDNSYLSDQIEEDTGVNDERTNYDYEG